MRFHVMSFEGPDAYSRAGGIATRICGLTANLAKLGFRTHLWFVGDPDLSGSEERDGVELHRWCQWISRYHPGGVYDGEEGKRLDYASSLPPYLFEKYLVPCLRAGERAVVFAEEWHTVDAVLHLDSLLRKAALRDRVNIFWNANNTFGFDRIDWKRLEQAAMITTVSRYMKQLMRGYGVDTTVIHNGLGADAFLEPDAVAVRAIRRRFRDRIVLGKVGRWDPDKNWLLAIAIVAELTRTASPKEFIGLLKKFHADPVANASLRASARVTARRYAWPEIIQVLLPRISACRSGNHSQGREPGTWIENRF